ncbi:Hypothetical predicted protein [Mytilus galloprovincialis]|uniref:Reverse transcriptase domain-containing protein n=1 Tax=Mytilus galloprovincialis TaxID=29158 RepID=A0A8B6BYF5_MYTGA|nr:Hypothetical predicted protein [Mytilus galloprovincialis]
MKKAFDTVEHHLLWFKLQRVCVCGQFLSAIQSLYNDLKCTVRIKSDQTPWFSVDAGVKQACIPSPTLFSVYINTLADRINSLECGVHIDDFRLSVLLYADDISLIAPDKESLQRMLNVVTEWCAECVNIGKTKIVHFHPQSFLRSDVLEKLLTTLIHTMDGRTFSFRKTCKRTGQSSEPCFGGFNNKNSIHGRDDF